MQRKGLRQWLDQTGTGPDQRREGESEEKEGIAKNDNAIDIEQVEVETEEVTFQESSNNPITDAIPEESVNTEPQNIDANAPLDSDGNETGREIKTSVDDDDLFNLDDLDLDNIDDPYKNSSGNVDEDDGFDFSDDDDDLADLEDFLTKAAG